MIIWKLVTCQRITSKRYSTSKGRHLCPRYGQVILVSGYPVLTAVNLSQHWCAIWVQYQSSCAPKLATKCEIEHRLSCGADGRSLGRVGGVRSRDYQIFSEFSPAKKYFDMSWVKHFFWNESGWEWHAFTWLEFDCRFSSEIYQRTLEKAMLYSIFIFY